MLFLVAGVRRSASTLAFQIACEIAGDGSRIRHWKKRPKHAIAIKSRWWVAKTHAYLPELAGDLEKGHVRIFSTIRDPRDIAVSIMQLYDYPDGKRSSLQEVMDRGWIQGDIETQRQWEKYAGVYYMTYHYEDFFKVLNRKRLIH